MSLVVAHPGAPCTPPVVNDGIVFCQHPLAPGIYVAECTEAQAEDLTRIPAFTVFGGTLTELPKTSDPAPIYDLSKPVAQWKNEALLARVKECWEAEAVQAKAAELKVSSPEDADRAGLMALAVASKPTE